MPKKNVRLVNLRRAHTHSQADMAHCLRVRQQTYAKYESGVVVPPEDIQALIAAKLGTSMGFIWPRPVEQQQAAS